MNVSAENTEEATLLTSPCTIQHQLVKTLTVFLSKRRTPFVRIGNNSVDYQFWYIYHCFDQTDCGLA